LTLVLPGATRAADDVAVEADSERQVSELEAAALRRDLPKVTVTIYGQVNRAIMYWDDGFQHGARGVDNSTSSSRLGLIGSGRIRSGLTAGYRMEYEFGPSLSETVSSDDRFSDQPQPRLRHSYVYVDSQDWGRVSLGHQSPATDDITIINLGSQMNDAPVHYNNSFPIPLAIGGRLVSDLTWGAIAHNVDSLRGNFVRYDTPAFGGFMLAAAWGEDDIWDVALRVSREWGRFRFAGGIGYMNDTTRDYRDVRGSLSVIHDPTGLYLSAAGGGRDDDKTSLSAHGQAYFGYAQLGISRRWLPFGITTAYVDAGLYRNFNVGELLRVDPQTGTYVIWGTLADTEVIRRGFGIEQAFDASNLLLYAQMNHYDATIVGFPCDANPSQFPNNCGGDPSNLVELPTRAWSAAVVGARIKF
jgi:predicted porin